MLISGVLHRVHAHVLPMDVPPEIQKRSNSQSPTRACEATTVFRRSRKYLPVVSHHPLCSKSQPNSNPTKDTTDERMDREREHTVHDRK
jgi:hypothetical protein